jgi:hypothetical protein
MKAALPLMAALAVLAACVPATKPAPAATAPAPAPRPAPIRPAPPPVVQAPAYDSWMDAPATPGSWRYQASAGGPIAVFIGAGGVGDFVLSCQQPGGPIGLWRAGTSAAPRIMIVRTETATRSLQVVQAEDTNPYLVASLAPGDPLLDAMALSKGRFAIETEGLAPLFLPSWAEVSRVIEDCR